MISVFLAIPPSANNAALPGSQIWEANLAESLKRLDVNLHRPDYDIGEQYRKSYKFLDRPGGSLIRQQYSQCFLESVRKTHAQVGLSLVLSYFYSGHIASWAVEEVKSLGILTSNFFCNAIHQFNLVAEIAPHFDYCIVPEREALPKYKAIGANPIYIQMAANPAVYKPQNVPIEYDVTFVGQKYLNRPEYLGYLHLQGIDVRAWGPGWVAQEKADCRRWPRRFTSDVRHWVRRRLKRLPTELPPYRCGPPLSDKELVKMYSRSQISLGFSDVQMPDGSVKRHIRLRDFEAPMSGALYFTGYQDELAEYYEIGKEIICYNDKEELLEKVSYYLAHLSQAERVRQAGLACARRDHTWENRFRQLFAAIGLPLGS